MAGVENNPHTAISATIFQKGNLPRRLRQTLQDAREDDVADFIALLPKGADVE